MNRSILAAAVLVASLPVSADSINASTGVTWIQADHNSNHAFAGSYELGYERGNFLATYNTGFTYDDPISQDSSNGPVHSNRFEHTVHGITLFLQPQLKYGSVTAKIGAGLGLVYDKVRMDTPVYNHVSTRSGFEPNFAMRLELSTKLWNNADVAVSVRQDYFELDSNRDYSDYEVNQDRITYSLGINYNF